MLLNNYKWSVVWFYLRIFPSLKSSPKKRTFIVSHTAGGKKVLFMLFLINTPTKNCVYFLERKNIESCQSKLMYVYIYIHIFFFNGAHVIMVGVRVFFATKKSARFHKAQVACYKKTSATQKLEKTQRTLKKPHTCSCQISILHWQNSFKKGNTWV